MPEARGSIPRLEREMPPYFVLFNVNNFRVSSGHHSQQANLQASQCDASFPVILIINIVLFG